MQTMTFEGLHVNPGPVLGSVWPQQQFELFVPSFPHLCNEVTEPVSWGMWNR